MARKRSRTGTAGGVLHFAGVRYRVTGAGNLQSTLHSLSDTQQDVLANLPMAAATDTEPFLHALFTQQRAYLEIKTTQINETFNISKIYFYVKPVASGYPQ